MPAQLKEVLYTAEAVVEGGRTVMAERVTAGSKWISRCPQR
jgi:hypothetical protein